MTDPIPPGGLVVTPTPPLWLQLQGQARIWLGPILGVAVGVVASRLHMPILNDLWGQQGPVIVGMIVTAGTQSAMSAWQWARTNLVNSRWWHLAIDPDVPDDKVRPAASVLTPKENVS
jgi:hypothetical protein